MDCECQDFIQRKIKKIGEFSEIKYIAEPCKHLQPLIDALIRIGYKIKEIKTDGTDKPTKELKKQLFNRCQGICEICHEGLATDVHRTKRGSSGGKYNLDNCKFICEECHVELHVSEFMGSKSK